MKPRVGYAFTLVELLVAVGIMLVIGGILVPVMARARAKGRQTACLSNVRQLGMADLMYAQDSDGYFPPFENTSPASVGPSGGGCAPDRVGPCDPRALNECLQPYVRAGDRARVWYCPDDQFAGQDVDYWGQNHKYSSYLYFRSFGSATTNLSVDGLVIWHPGAPAIVPPEVIVPPTRAPLIGDQGQAAAAEGPTGETHFGGANYAFVDGHAKWEPPGRR